MTVVTTAQVGTIAAPAGKEQGQQAWSTSGHLRQFELFRVVACVSVVAQHSVLWVVPASSKVGWGLVLLGYYTREAFLFLTAFLGFFSHKANPRSTVSLWRRRLGGIIVPYLVWTAIYYAYQLIERSGSRNDLQMLGNDLRYGYFQLYFLVVIAQFYVVFPLLAALVRATRGHHIQVLAASVAAELALTSFHHYLEPSAGLAWHISAMLLNPLLLSCYQAFVIAGMLAADHLAELQRFVARRSAALLAAAAVGGIATEVYYQVLVWTNHQTGYASDLFQPIAMVWFGLAIVGLYCLGYRWALRMEHRERSWRGAVVRWGSHASGGVYLSHVLVLQLVLIGLGGVRNSMPWEATSAILLVTSLAGSTLLVSLLRRTPLRRAL
ncbi:MAG: acyltransferase [Acidimicrobiales bacterium]